MQSKLSLRVVNAFLTMEEKVLSFYLMVLMNFRISYGQGV